MDINRNTESWLSWINWNAKFQTYITSVDMKASWKAKTTTKNWSVSCFYDAILPQFTGKDCEGCCHSLLEVTSRMFSGRDWGKPWMTSVTIASTRAEVHSKHYRIQAENITSRPSCSENWLSKRQWRHFALGMISFRVICGPVLRIQFSENTV
jgi:hypothetical protein